MPRVRFATGILALTMVWSFAGCNQDGPATAAVQGVVTLDGAPLADATVEFQPAAGAPSYGVTDDEGRYELRYSGDKRGAILGTHRVSISTFRVSIDAQGRESALPEKVPARYNATTQLQAKVKAVSNAIDFNLDAK